MKKVLVSALVVCALSMSSVAFAQENKEPDRQFHEKKEMVKKKAQELNLTEEQMEQIKASKDEMREANKAARQKHQENMDQILTPEQKEKMKETRERNIEKRKMRHLHKQGNDSVRRGQKMRTRHLEKKHDCSQQTDSCRMHKPCKKEK